MRFSILIFSVIFLFISCGSSKDETGITLVIGPRSGATVSPGRNIDLKNSFLLTGQNLAAIKRENLAVNENGDIFIADSKQVKVYDSDGNGKYFISEFGEPADSLNFILYTSIGPNGHLTASNPLLFHFFDSEYNYRFSKNFIGSRVQKEVENVLGVSRFYPFNVVSLGTDERYYYIKAESKNGEIVSRLLEYTVLAYENEDQLNVFAQYEPTNIVATELGSGINWYLGTLLWTVLPDGKMAYTHPGHDKSIDGEKREYTIHIFSPSDFNKTEMKKSYDLIEINPVNLRKVVIFPFDALVDEMKTFNSFKEDFLNDLDYFLPVQRIFSDNNLLFVVLYETDMNGRFKVDVFDIRDFDYIKSVYFEKVPNAVRNGEIYVLNLVEDETTGGNKLVIERFKIDN